MKTKGTSMPKLSPHCIGTDDRQRGQALVFTLVFAAAAGLVSLLLFNSGILANTKTRLQNAADAGAYSAALLQARDHNFSAYTNRAMVANQVAVAQLVSLKSYLEDAADTHDRMEGWWLTLMSKIPTTTTSWDIALKIPIKNVDSIYSGIAPKAVNGLDLLIKGLETAQGVHHAATLAGMIFVADEVVKRNDPLASVTTGAFSLAHTTVQVKTWSDSTHQHSANDSSKEADRFADVVVDSNSTDSFTRNRIGGPTTAWWASSVNPLACPGGVPGFTGFAFTHAGSTQLSTDKKRWLGLDATEGLGAYSCTYVTPLGPVLVVIPIFDAIGNTGFIPGGSGGAVAGANGGYPDLNGYKNNPTSTMLYGGAAISPPGLYRYNVMGPGSTLDAGGGLQDTYRDMTDPTNTATIPKNQTAEENGGNAPITIEVERKATTIRTSSKFLTTATIVKLDDGMKGDTMRTLSSAHSYFYRSSTDSTSFFKRTGWKRDDDKVEIANLFSPYWQTRLVDRTIVERGASWLAQ